LKGSALTSGKEVKDGHYTDETAKATVVPNRNAIMLNIAWGIAVAEQANIVATAVHAGDHYVYPDCQPEFISEMNAAMRLATMGFAEPTLHLHTPYLNWSKADIVRAGSMMLNAEGTHVSPVPYGLTWSCYRGEDMACGKCPTCVERLEAFWLADRKDPLAYMDRTWWQTVSKIFPDLPEHDRNANIARDYFIDTRESV
jgi:7-cyano-7-deazaguanine synthase